jgi:polyhydroxyalkanoate synthesis regulator phasin
MPKLHVRPAAARERDPEVLLARIEALEQRVETLEAEADAQDGTIDELFERVSDLEKQL